MINKLKYYRESPDATGSKEPATKRDCVYTERNRYCCISIELANGAIIEVNLLAVIVILLKLTTYHSYNNSSISFNNITVKAREDSRPNYGAVD